MSDTHRALVCGYMRETLRVKRNIGVDGWLRHSALFLLTMTVLVGCTSEKYRNSDVEFESCVISQKALAEAMQRMPDKTEPLRKYFSHFEFNQKKLCYSQSWKMPRAVKGMTTEGASGEAWVRLNFPYKKQEGRQARGYAENLAGIEVSVRPVGTFIKFADKSNFREERLGNPTSQIFQGHEVYSEKSEDPLTKRRVLFDKEHKDLIAFLELKPGSSQVSEASVDSLVHVVSHVDDRFEISYVLVWRQLDEINSINEEIRSRVRSYLKK